jgi:surface antigen
MIKLLNLLFVVKHPTYYLATQKNIDSHEMGDAGRDYLDILGNFYSQPIGLVDITTGKFSISVKQCMSSGLKLGTDGYYMRTTIPEENNIYFNAPYTLDSSRGQCVWYVKGRAQEIIANSIADADKKEKAKNAITPFMANGNGWYSPELTKVFGSSQDYKLPKAGAIAVYDWTDAECLSYWQSRGSNTCVQKYGHALIVESVDGDNVSISQGWTRCSTGSPAWSCVNFSYTTHPISYMKDLGGGYKFIGYIYLLN